MRQFTVFKGHPKGGVRQSTTQKPDQLVGDQVYVRVTASGICGTGMCFRVIHSHHFSDMD